MLAKKINSLLWPKLIPNRYVPSPGDPDWSEHERHSKDGVKIFIRCLRCQEQAKGTILFAHGFTANSGHYYDFAYHLRYEYQTHVILPDMRHHGRSGDRAITFGTAESWDLAACLAYAEENGFPKPYIVLGDSLGAMAVQRLLSEDQRIDYAICVHPPGWPWDAIGKNVEWTCDNALDSLPFYVRKFFTPLKNASVKIGNVINSEYKFNILDDGDPRFHTQYPPASPKILYVFGDQDPYDYGQAMKVWEHFYPDSEAKANVRPSQAPDQKKYFIVVPGFRHFPPGPTVFDWDGFWPLLHEFLE